MKDDSRCRIPIVPVIPAIPIGQPRSALAQVELLASAAARRDVHRRPTR